MNRSEVVSFLRSRLFAIILVGFIIRYALAPVLTYGFDVTGWALGMENILSGSGLYDVDGYYYTPVWGYFMGFLAAFQDLFLNICSFGGVVPEALSVEHTGWYYTADLTTVSLNVFIKSFFFVIDLLVAYLIYWLVNDMTGDRKKAELGFAVWFLCPVVIVVGAVGGMFDSLVALFIVITVIMVRRDHLLFAGFFFVLSVYLKLFPAFLMFPLLAYLFVNHRGCRMRRFGEVVVGAVLATALVFVPMIFQGHGADTFGFIFSRFTQGIGSGVSSSLEGIGTVIGYLAIAIVSVLVSYHYTRIRSNRDFNRTLEVLVLVAAIVFLYPSAPQYLLMLFPLVAVLVALGYGQIKWPAVVLAVASAMFVMSHNAVLLLSFSEYTGLIPTDAVISAVNWFHESYCGVSAREILYYGSGVVQWIAALWMSLVMARTFLKHTGAVPSETSIPAQIRTWGAKVICALKTGTMLQREVFFMAVFAVLAVVIFCIVQLTGMPSSVVDGYFQYADAMYRGVFPYTEKVFVYGDWNVWEYPPLAYVFILLPRLFGSTPATYQIAYLVMVLLFIWLGMRSVGRIAEHYGYGHLKAVTAYFFTVLLMSEFVFDRYDIIPMVVCILAMQFFVERRYVPAAAMVAVGTLVKLYPAVLLPVFIICLLYRREHRELARSAVAFCAVMLLAVPFVLLGDISQFLTYHSERPLEIESLYASVLEVFALIFPDSGMHVMYSFGSDNLVGGAADVVSGYVFYVTVIAVVASWIIYAYTARRDNSDVNIFRAMFLSVGAFVLFNSVFSGQYIIWLIPFFLLVLITGDRGACRLEWVLFIIISVFTQLNFLFNFGMRAEGAFLSVAGVLVLLVRNSAFLVMMAGYVRDMLSRRVV